MALYALAFFAASYLFLVKAWIEMGLKDTFVGSLRTHVRSLSMTTSAPASLLVLYLLNEFTQISKLILTLFPASKFGTFDWRQWRYVSVCKITLANGIFPLKKKAAVLSQRIKSSYSSEPTCAAENNPWVILSPSLCSLNTNLCWSSACFRFIAHI